MESGGAPGDVLGGALIVASGVFVLIEGYRYDVGTLSAMGGGFFPIVLGTVLAILGAVIAINALPTASFEIAPRRWVVAAESETRARPFRQAGGRQANHVFPFRPCAASFAADITCPVIWRMCSPAVVNWLRRNSD